MTQNPTTTPPVQTMLTPGIVARITDAARYVVSGVTPSTWFGPLQPLKPMAPAEVAGRRFDYPTGYNLNSTPRSYEAISFDDLRSLADNCDILRSVIETRKDQMEALDWTLRVVPQTGGKHMPSDDQKRRMDAITQFLQCPDKEHSFSQWLRQILEDMFVIDAACIYKRYTRGGDLYALEILDGATIKILLGDDGRAPLPPDPAYQQVLKGVPAADYTRDELLYLTHNPRSHKVYGYSHVEQVLVTVNILIRRALHQLEYYKDGSQPDAFVGLPKEWDIEQIAAFQKHFDAMMAGNLGLRRRLRFMPGDFHYTETKQPPLKDMYDEYLARIICFVFSVSPEPFVSHVNRATAESSQSRATDEGLAPLQRYVRGFMNRIVKREFNSPDLEFAWQDTREQDPKEAASIDVAYVSAGILTVNEVRAGMGLPPVAWGNQLVNSPSVKKNFSEGLKKDDGEDDDEESDEDDESEKDDDSEDEEGDDKDDENEDSKSSDEDDNDNFNAKHPRQPAGSPGGIGGEFAPKDGGASAGTAAPTSDSGSISTDDIRNAIIDGMNGPSQLGDGTQISMGGSEFEQRALILQETEQQGMAERQASETDSAVQAEEATGVKGFAQDIANAVTGAPYVNSDGTLLNADQANIDVENKIINYSLNPDHEKGGDKAIVFNSALGYNQSNFDSLVEQLQQGVVKYPATASFADQYGQRFSVAIPVTGPNGNIVTVTSAWIYDPGSNVPRLTSAYIRK